MPEALRVRPKAHRAPSPTFLLLVEELRIEAVWVRGLSHTLRADWTGPRGIGMKLLFVWELIGDCWNRREPFRWQYTYGAA